jgi:hypothetical protein
MDLPMSRDQAHQFASWIKGNFREPIEGVLAGTPFTIDIACGIACQETGIFLLGFTHKLSPKDALARCVFDASGDADGTTRGAFPQNTASFKQTMGGELTDMLIAEANQTRALRGLRPAAWVYKGYGIFQYDLQNIRADDGFFRNRGWGEFDQCLSRLLTVLNRKYAATHDVFQSIRAYNGSGRAADNYLANVRQFIEFSSEVH